MRTRPRPTVATPKVPQYGAKLKLLPSYRALRGKNFLRRESYFNRTLMLLSDVGIGGREKIRTLPELPITLGA